MLPNCKRDEYFAELLLVTIPKAGIWM